MKFLTVWIGLLAVAIMSDIIAASDSSQENDQDYLKRVLQTILKDPEYLSLGLAEQQQILIAFFHIFRTIPTSMATRSERYSTDSISQRWREN